MWKTLRGVLCSIARGEYAKLVNCHDVYNELDMYVPRVGKRTCHEMPRVRTASVVCPMGHPMDNGLSLVDRIGLSRDIYYRKFSLLKVLRKQCASMLLYDDPLYKSPKTSIIKVQIS